MKKVRNNAKLMMTWFGGVCCKPRAVLTIDRTIEIRTKDVTIIKIDGARPSTVISMKICSSLLVIELLDSRCSISFESESDATEIDGKKQISANKRAAEVLFMYILVYGDFK